MQLRYWDFRPLSELHLKSNTIYGGAYQGDYPLESKQVIKAIDSFIENHSDVILKDKVNQYRKTKNAKTITASGYLNFLKKNSNVYNDVINEYSTKIVILFVTIAPSITNV